MGLEAFGQPSALEQDAGRAVTAGDYQTFERYVSFRFSFTFVQRRVVQLKSLFQNNANLVPTESTYKTLGLYLLYLLASERVADFHTELESLSSHEQSNAFIKYPIQLERYIMEGNYAKVLVEKRDKVFDVLFHKLQGAVQARQQQTRAASATAASVAVASATDAASAMGILSNMIGYATDLERIV